MAINFLKIFPLIEAFVDSSTSNKLAALKEILVTGIFSFLPLFLAACVLTLTSDSNDPISFLAACKKVVAKGELLLYASSIVAPIIYLVLHEPGGEKRYRERMLQGVLVFLVLLVCYSFYALMYAGIVTNLEFLATISYIAISCSIFLWYVASVFRNMMNNGFDPRMNETSFKKDLFKHRDQY